MTQESQETQETSETLETPTDENNEPDTYWFIGLHCDKSEGSNIDLTADLRQFLNTVRQSAANKMTTEYKIEFKYVRKRDLVNYLPAHVLKSETNTTTTTTTTPVKRKLEDEDDDSKRAKQKTEPNAEITTGSTPPQVTA